MKARKIGQTGGNQLKRSTLFDVSPVSAYDIDTLRAGLNPAVREQIEALSQMIARKIGTYEYKEEQYYRVTNTNYIKVKLHGSQGYFYLLMTLTGYTELPKAEAHSLRASFSLIDATDAHWLQQLILHTLTQSNEVSNEVA